MILLQLSGSQTLTGLDFLFHTLFKVTRSTLRERDAFWKITCLYYYVFFAFFQLEDLNIARIAYLANLLELCHFKRFWQEKAQDANLISQITGFDDAVRKFVCHVVNITYQSMDKTVLKELLGGITGEQFAIQLIHLT